MNKVIRFWVVVFMIVSTLCVGIYILGKSYEKKYEGFPEGFFEAPEEMTLNTPIEEEIMKREIIYQTQTDKLFYIDEFGDTREIEYSEDEIHNLLLDVTKKLIRT